MALEKIGSSTGWVASDDDMSVWRDNGSGPPVTEGFPLNQYFSGHDWLGTCLDPGTYYLLVRHCSFQIDTIQGYRVVLNLEDSPGDYCSNAIPIDVLDFNPAAASVIVNCHTIGTDVGEVLNIGNTCFAIPKQKTSWFKVHVAAGPKVDLKFQLGENFSTPLVDLSDVSYRILAGSCGALTPIACSEGNINLTLFCLGPGDYYVQVAMPEKISGGPSTTDLDGTLSLTVTATPANDVTCTVPFDPSEVTANFFVESDCQSISFFNQSTAGTDIEYLWVFPDGTSSEINPVWTPAAGAGMYTVTLITKNIVLNLSDTVALVVSLVDPFASFVPMNDQVLCNEETLMMNATYSNATYLWDDNSSNPIRVIQQGGVYWVILTIDQCSRVDSFIVNEIHAEEDIQHTLCAGESIVIHGEVFDESHPNGVITLPGADPSGCDSLLSVQVSFIAPVLHPFSDTICSGESYAFANQQLTQTGIYNDTLTSAKGCDSIIVLSLQVTPKQLMNRALSDCVGNAVLLMPGHPG
jgi:PKD repeat protein